MNRVLIAIAAFVVWSLFAGFIGWQVRDGRADAAVAKTEGQQQTARADQAEGARATDHANDQAGAQAQQQRAGSHAASESNFRDIEKRAIQYVQKNPDPDGCDLDGDGLRAWREANAGTVFASPEPGHTGRPTGP